MVTEKMIEVAARCIDPDVFAILDGGDQWRIINSHYQREAAKDKAKSALEAALSTDAEPVAITILASEYKALRDALKPFAKYAGNPEHLKQRAFLQLLICPLGDNHPDNHMPYFQAALAALALTSAEDHTRG